MKERFEAEVSTMEGKRVNTGIFYANRQNAIGVAFARAMTLDAKPNPNDPFRKIRLREI
jgi:hypothetical protein